MSDKATDSPDRLAKKDDVEITPKMVEAGLRVLRDSGVLEYENLVDESLMRRILWVSFACR